MSGNDADAASPIGRVRRIYWVLLIATLVVAMAIPTMTLWHAASAALRVRAYIWPATPHVGEVAHVVVVPLDSADATATEGPWAHVLITLDMVDMTMDVPPVSAPGRAGSETFAVTLLPEMAGIWRASVRLETPGRPAWQASLRFLVAPPVVAGQGSGAQAGGVALSPVRGVSATSTGGRGGMRGET